MSTIVGQRLGFGSGGITGTMSAAEVIELAVSADELGFGSHGPRALALTGEVADGWLPSLGRLTLDQATAMRETVRAAAKAAGRDPDEITCSVVTFAEHIRPVDIDTGFQWRRTWRR
jgi:Luciferase-like monooxygenase